MDRLAGGILCETILFVKVFPESPLLRLMLIVTACVFGILIMREVFSQDTGETVVERNRRFLVGAAWLSLGAFGIRQILLLIEKYVASSLLDGLAAFCFWVSIAAFGGAGMIFYAASEEARAKALQDFFRPLNIVKSIRQSNRRVDEAKER